MVFAERHYLIFISRISGNWRGISDLAHITGRQAVVLGYFWWRSPRPIWNSCNLSGLSDIRTGLCCIWWGIYRSLRIMGVGNRQKGPRPLRLDRSRNLPDRCLCDALFAKVIKKSILSKKGRINQPFFYTEKSTAILETTSLERMNSSTLTCAKLLRCSFFWNLMMVFVLGAYCSTDATKIIVFPSASRELSILSSAKMMTDLLPAHWPYRPLIL